jgi:hypothetical protein
MSGFRVMKTENRGQMTEGGNQRKAFCIVRMYSVICLLIGDSWNRKS